MKRGPANAVLGLFVCQEMDRKTAGSRLDDGLDERILNPNPGWLGKGREGNVGKYWSLGSRQGNGNGSRYLR